MTRRNALKQMFNVLAAIGATSFFTLEDLEAIERGQIEKPNLIWLHASSCSGCSTSFLNIEDVPLVDILTKYTNVLFHPDVSLATGEQVSEILHKAKQKPFIFVLEGSVPTALPHACLMAGRPMLEWIKELGESASVSISAGTCASFGGITTMDGMVAGGKTLKEFYKMYNITSPIVNLPNCPLKPEHLVYTLFYNIKTGKLPPLDKQLRPKRFFANTVHERCIYYSDYQENNFAKKIGDNACMFKLGCQGIVTKNDCLQHGHNNNTNICIRAGHPCIGCAGEKFPRQIMMRTYNDKRVIKNFRVIS